MALIFPCQVCQTQLQADESQVGQLVRCPTCLTALKVPTPQRVAPPAHAAPAMAGAGVGVGAGAGVGIGQRPAPPITANNCKSCGMPFTMEGTTLEAAGQSNGWCVASLVLGIIGIPAGCTIVAPLLAIIFGIIGLNQVSKNGGEGGGKGMAIAGII